MEKSRPEQPLAKAENEVSALDKLKANRKRITCLSIFIFVVLVVALAWYFISQNGSRKADDAVALADMEQNDSTRMALYRQAAEAGYKSGSRAAAMVAIQLYQDKKYDEAIEYLDKVSFDDNVAAAGVYALKGDCYSNLEKYDDALSCYDKAIDKADENPSIVPVMLVKEANIYRHLGKYADEAEVYNKIIKEYPAYAQTSQIDIRKFYERAKTQAGL